MYLLIYFRDSPSDCRELLAQIGAPAPWLGALLEQSPAERPHARVNWREWSIGVLYVLGGALKIYKALNALCPTPGTSARVRRGERDEGGSSRGSRTLLHECLRAPTTPASLRARRLKTEKVKSKVR